MMLCYAARTMLHHGSSPGGRQNHSFAVCVEEEELLKTMQGSGLFVTALAS